MEANHTLLSSVNGINVLFIILKESNRKNIWRTSEWLHESVCQVTKEYQAALMVGHPSSSNSANHVHIVLPWLPLSRRVVSSYEYMDIFNTERLSASEKRLFICSQCT